MVDFTSKIQFFIHKINIKENIKDFVFVYLQLCISIFHVMSFHIM